MKSNEIWLADITYVPTREGWLYLAAVEDLYSRRVVGWSMGTTMEIRLVVDALEMAVKLRFPDAGLVAHSDRGSQYASEHYRRAPADKGITCSMSRKGDCYDNAPMESFFATLKKELSPAKSSPAEGDAPPGHGGPLLDPEGLGPGRGEGNDEDEEDQETSGTAGECLKR